MSWQIEGLSLDEIHWNSFQLGFKEEGMGGPWTPQHRKKINEHRMTARKVHETPSLQQLFLATYNFNVFIWRNTFMPKQLSNN